MPATLDISINNEFTNRYGEFTNYDTYDFDLLNKIRKTKHIDIRSFIQDDTIISIEDFNLSQAIIDAILEVDSEDIVLSKGENWTEGTVGPASAFNYHNTLSLSFVDDVVVTESVTDPIDLTGFTDNDFILLICNYEDEEVDLGNSYLDLIDADDVTVSLKLEDAIIESTGNFRWSFSELTNDRSKIVKVGFRLASVVDGDFHILALQAIDKDWEHGSVKIDTNLQRLSAGTPPAGDIDNEYDYTFPILWRADEPSGENDPQPIDTTVQVAFYSGTLDNSLSNRFSLYFREVSKDFMQQLDLNGMDMSELNGNPQPDIGENLYAPRPQSDLDQYLQQGLDNQEQFDLERTHDALAASWIEVTCQWSDGSGTLYIVNSESTGYSFNLGSVFETNTRYVLIAQIENKFARVKIIPLTENGDLAASPIFDSLEIHDDNVIRRRKGRFGWSTSFQNGDVYIESIRATDISFAEHKTFPFESLTPVAGAQLYTEQSPNLELFSGFTSGPWNLDSTIVTLDQGKSNSPDGAFKIQTIEGYAQGVQSNSFYISNWNTTEIKFDAYILSSDTQLRAFVVSPSYQIKEVVWPTQIYNQWYPVHIRLPFKDFQTGFYKLILMQIDETPTTWWIDNVSIFERALSWDARSYIGDPWSDAAAPWTPFWSHINNADHNIKFPLQGKTLQLRGKAHKQTSRIDKIELVPKYAELGRVVFADTAIYNDDPVADFDATDLGGGSNTATFESTSTDDERIVLSEWLFGDGQKATGTNVEHTYSQPGNYLVTLVVVDNNGNRGSNVQTVGVS